MNTISSELKHFLVGTYYILSLLPSTASQINLLADTHHVLLAIVIFIYPWQPMSVHGLWKHISINKGTLQMMAMDRIH